MESVVKSILFIPQTAIGPPLRVLIFEISHFDISGFKKKTERKFKKKKLKPVRWNSRFSRKI